MAQRGQATCPTSHSPQGLALSLAPQTLSRIPGRAEPSQAMARPPLGLQPCISGREAAGRGEGAGPQPHYRDQQGPMPGPVPQRPRSLIFRDLGPHSYDLGSPACLSCEDPRYPSSDPWKIPALWWERGLEADKTGFRFMEPASRCHVALGHQLPHLVPSACRSKAVAGAAGLVGGPSCPSRPEPGLLGTTWPGATCEAPALGAVASVTPRRPACQAQPGTRPPPRCPPMGCCLAADPRAPTHCPPERPPFSGPGPSEAPSAVQ